MAVEYADSFAYSTSQITRRYSSNSASAGQNAMTIGGPGTAGYYLQGASDQNWIYCPVTARSEYYVGFDFQSSSPSGIMVDFQTVAGTSICAVSVGASGAVATPFGNSSTGVIVASTYQQIQVYIKRHASAGIITVKVDGVTVISLTGQNTGATDIGRLMLGHGPTFGGGGTNRWANFWVFNTSGSHSNTFPIGRMKVQPLVGSADGTYTAWTPNSGSTHYNRVNEIPPDDDTTYNSAISLGDKDSVACTDLAAGVLNVHGVQITAAARKDDVDPKNFQVFTKSGATETFSADIQATLTYSSSTKDGAPALLLQDDPNTSAAWTVTNVNALEIGVKVTL